MSRQQDNNAWYSLDTAALVYPAIVSPEQPTVFRLSCTLAEDIAPDLLEAALELTLRRYPGFRIRMKKGAFWFYFEANPKSPILDPETTWPCQFTDPETNHDYLFRLAWYGPRVSLEFFHAIADGSGGLEFLKTLVFYYLQLRGLPVAAEGLVHTLADPEDPEEIENSFLRYYDPLAPSDRGMGEKAFHYSGTELPFPQTRALHAQFDTRPLLDLCRAAGATVSEYLTAVLARAFLEALPAPEKKGKPIVVSVPVNLRTLFPSRTLRNFTYFMNIAVPYGPEALGFEEILALVRTQFSEQNRREVFLPRMNPNVSAERNPLLRVAPVQVKNVVLKTGRRIVGDDLFTISFSNLGRVTLPESMRPYVLRFDFGLSTTEINPLNLSMCSYGERTFLTFSAMIEEKAVEGAFLRFLSGKGLDIFVETSADSAPVPAGEEAEA